MKRKAVANKIFEIFSPTLREYKSIPDYFVEIDHAVIESVIKSDYTAIYGFSSSSSHKNKKFSSSVQNNFYDFSSFSTPQKSEDAVSVRGALNFTTTFFFSQKGESNFDYFNEQKGEGFSLRLSLDITKKTKKI